VIENKLDNYLIPILEISFDTCRSQTLHQVSPIEFQTFKKFILKPKKTLLQSKNLYFRVLRKSYSKPPKNPIPTPEKPFFRPPKYPILTLNFKPQKP
jgi:hypothetical protein